MRLPTRALTKTLTKNGLNPGSDDSSATEIQKHKGFHELTQ